MCQALCCTLKYRETKDSPCYQGAHNTIGERTKKKEDFPKSHGQNYMRKHAKLGKGKIFFFDRVV